MLERKLTGNYYFKPTVLGLVLLVEKEFEFSDERHPDPKVEKEKYFTKASIEDAFALNLVSNATIKKDMS